MKVSEISALEGTAYLAKFGPFAEHSPWVAERARSIAGPFDTRSAMIDAFQRALTTATEKEQLAVIRAHPDLAGKAALAGELEAHSMSEQAGVGLDQLTQAELDLFTNLNGGYLDKFGFPFIFAVKGANKHQILDAFETRLSSTQTEEFLTAIAQVCRIIRFRLEEMVDEL